MKDELRPQSFDEYVGQPNLKARLDIAIRSALTRETVLEPILLAGPPGVGKTAMAAIIADCLYEDLAVYNMPMKPRTLSIVVREHMGVLLLDEVHRAPKRQQEDLLPLLEHGYLQSDSGRRIEPLWLSIVAATTEPEKVIPPLYDRFVIKQPFEPYSVEEMTEIAFRMSRLADVHLDSETLEVFGQAATGIPRNARQFILTARDLQALGEQVTADRVLSLCRVDYQGLSIDHERYLECLDRMEGGKAGLAILSSLLRLHPSVVNGLERLLLEKEMINLTPTGRELTPVGRRHLHPPKTRKERNAS